MKEEWKDIIGYEGLYQISNFGRVKSLGKFQNAKLGSIAFRPEKILKGSPDTKGYLRVKLQRNTIKKNCKIHRLVGEMFIPNPLSKPEINHKDGIKTNNYYWNLEWATSSENNQHAFDNKLKIMPKGENVYNAKLTSKNVIEARNLYNTGKFTHKKLALIFGITRGGMSKILKKQSYKNA
jgi:hypothetical protein